MQVCVFEEQVLCVAHVLTFYFLAFNITFYLKASPNISNFRNKRILSFSSEKRSNGEIKRNFFVDVGVISAFRRLCVV
jgi:hypothetical protein